MMDVMKTILDSCGEIQISPKGTSMKPYLLEKRDRVRVVPVEDCLRIYDIVLYKSCGLYILHRVVGVDKDDYLICGDNTEVIERVPKDSIIGVAYAIVRKSGNVEKMDEIKSKIWISLWYKRNFKKYYITIKKKLGKILKRA